MKKTTLIVISTVAIACMSSAWGLGINAGFSPKELTPELAVSIGAMNSSLSVSGSRGMLMPNYIKAIPMYSILPNL